MKIHYFDLQSNLIKRQNMVYRPPVIIPVNRGEIREIM